MTFLHSKQVSKMTSFKKYISILNQIKFLPYKYVSQRAGLRI